MDMDNKQEWQVKHLKQEVYLGNNLKMEEDYLDNNNNNNNNQLYLANNSHNNKHQDYLALQLLLLNPMDNNKEAYLDRHPNKHNKQVMDMDNNQLLLHLGGHLFMVNSNHNNRFNLFLVLEEDWDNKVNLVIILYCLGVQMIQLMMQLQNKELDWKIQCQLYVGEQQYLMYQLYLLGMER